MPTADPPALPIERETITFDNITPARRRGDYADTRKVQSTGHTHTQTKKIQVIIKKSTTNENNARRTCLPYRLSNTASQVSIPLPQALQEQIQATIEGSIPITEDSAYITNIPPPLLQDYRPSYTTLVPLRAILSHPRAAEAGAQSSRVRKKNWGGGWKPHAGYDAIIDILVQRRRNRQGAEGRLLKGFQRACQKPPPTTPAA